MREKRTMKARCSRRSQRSKNQTEPWPRSFTTSFELLHHPPLSKNLVRDARVRQGRQSCLLLSIIAEVQDEILHARLSAQRQPRRRCYVAGRICAQGVGRLRRDKDRRARQESC